ncbi:glycosyltransferase family 9 protein [Oligoflexaceae bacterium]|nr:glycosyltransferase family 9 protein [Oligoflexaceae bacterium]
MGKLVLGGNAHIDEHIIYSEQMSLGDKLSVVKRIRSKKYDLVLDFMNNPRSALFCWFSKAKKTLAFDSKRSFFYNQTVAKPSGSAYIVEQKMSLLSGLGSLKPSEGLMLPWGPEDLEPLKTMLSENENFSLAKIRVVLSPTHRRKARIWPQQHYAVLADFLYEKWGASVTWVWGPGEEKYIDDTMARCQHSSLKAPKTSFKELACLIANHDLFIGNSNGPSHVAVATGISSLQLHGPTLAKSWCPHTDFHQSIQSPQVKDSATISMAFITLPVVIKKLEKMRPVIDKVSQSRRNFGIMSSSETRRVT